MTELEQQLMEQNKALLEQVRQLTEQIQYLNKKLFGASSEKNKIAEGQISLFNPDDFLKRQRQLRNKPSKRSRIDVKNKKEEKQN